MILQDKKSNTYTRQVNEFKGLNRMPVREDGELSECTNLVFDLYPVMSVRKGRTKFFSLEDFLGMEIQNNPGGVSPSPDPNNHFGQGIINAAGKVAFVMSGTLIYDGTATLMDLSPGHKSMVEFWGKIFVFPDKKYYDIETGQVGNIGTSTNPLDKTMCPDMDYVCVHNNRIWGVKGNDVYASALGWALGAASPEGKNGWTAWHDANNEIDDGGSYMVQVASDGDFKGIASWDDRVVLLKERCHHEIMGSYPSNFKLSTVSKAGTIDHRSIAEVSGKLFFGSRSGVYAYVGGFESEVARKLRLQNEGCAGVGVDGKYYLFCGDQIFVYDATLGIWTEEGGFDQGVVGAAVIDGIVYAQLENGNVWKLNDPDSTEKVEWSFTFNDYLDSVYAQNEIQKMVLKMKATPGTAVRVEMSTDGKKYVDAKNYVFRDAALQTIKFPLNRGTEHDIRVSGVDETEIYGFQLIVQKGGENIV